MKIEARNTTQYLRHVKELEALGAENGHIAYEQLCRLEKKAHKLAEDLCNFEIAEEIQDKRSDQITHTIKKIFNGKVPMGFRINYDPRGYALKINDGQNRIFINSEDGQNHDEKVISYTDWGGYGILAPEF